MSLSKYCISFEGIDCSGKDAVGKYVNILGKYKYVLMDRGLMSNITYAKLHGRDYKYDLAPYKHWVIVYLTVDREDWEVRCKLKNEPPIDYDVHSKAFCDTAVELDKAGITILVYNTTKYTPYLIAKDIIRYMEDREKEDNGQHDQGENSAV